MESVIQKESSALRRNLAQRIGASWLVRFHMFLIVTGTVMAALVSSKVLTLLGITRMPIRYGITAILSYLFFFGFIKLWLVFIGVGSVWSLKRNKKKGDASFIDAIPSSGDSAGSGGSSGSFGGFGGGSSGGGGATGSFVETNTSAPIFVSSGAPSSARAGAGQGLSDALDIGDDFFGRLVAIILLVALVFSIAIAGAYVIWTAPAILSEAALQALLVSGFAGKVRKAEKGGWEASVLKSTWWAFLLVLVFAVAFGVVAQKVAPSAVTVKDLVTYLR